MTNPQGVMVSWQPLDFRNIAVFIGEMGALGWKVCWRLEALGHPWYCRLTYLFERVKTRGGKMRLLSSPSDNVCMLF